MSGTDWVAIEERAPEPGELVLGWDVYYDNYHLVRWDGSRRTSDDNLPRLLPQDGFDDMWIAFWMPLPPPPRSA
jgi:hypothetical protein